ncbi:TrlF family AAA-like ATPase [Paenibacillus sp. JDR-2]|uniref:TrlF family AAA-like ATPase n=1 Tax=Paenibacillus sp. (strain JDR-2) TaxID=324057 RepID=UPI0001668CD2|nr:ABC transporter [Paenibacillus sp. JDR-2]ACT03371.1 ABC transporter [Paenibacillus sp. JDR-2]
MIFSKGSEWRRWDLHVHTPESYQQRFGQDWERYITALKERAVHHDIEVVGITDYFSVDGYEKIKREHANGETYLQLSNGKKLFLMPCIELRLDAFDTRENSINLHLVFNPKLAASTIKSSLLDNLDVIYQDTTLKCKHDDLVKIGYAEANGGSFNINLDIQSIEHIDQKKYKKIALDMITISMEKLKNVLSNCGISREDYLILVAYKGHGSLSNMPWSDQNEYTGRLGNIKQTLLNLADLCFTHNQADINFLLGKSTYASVETFRTRFRSLKPSVWGSDAHDLNNLFHPSNGASQHYTWIKADPTFEGLKQIINEPEERVFIGVKPTKLKNVSDRKTKHIRSLRIQKKLDSTLQEIWFDNELYFNPGLVAVIGNKGSGKSALADVLGLMGDTPYSTSFSFLTESRFKQKRDNKAMNFEGVLTWEDNTVIQKSLNDSINPTSVERIRYLPQNYFETICNEMASGEKSYFDAEIKKVIYQYVSEADKLSKETLNELIAYKTIELRESVQLLQVELSKVNTEIVELEKKASDKYMSTIQSQLSLKQGELFSHETSVPKEIAKPNIDPEIEDLISSKQKELSGFENTINDLMVSQSSNELALASAEKLLNKLANFETRFDTFKSECQDEMNVLGINFDDVISFNVNDDPINLKKNDLLQIKKDIADKLDPIVSTSIQNLKDTTEQEIVALQNKLDEPNKEYQAYLSEVKKWEEKKQLIIGDIDIVGSLKHIEEKLEETRRIPATLQHLNQRRMHLLRNVFGKIREEVNLYENLYNPIQDIIQTNVILKDSLKLRFEVSVKINNSFQENLLKRLNRRAKGSFNGVTEGDQVLKNIIDRFDYNTEDGVVGLIEEIVKHLHYDMRNDSSRKIEIEEQLRQGESVQEIYDYIFSLSYLEPMYQLKLNDKELAELSPGERGIILLIFYLLLDKDDIPLVIDQPEDNLDNQTVYNLLVPCIRESKKTRQIFIVTHNPNLAVVCDAEQVICASIEKSNGNQLIYESGSIENSLINKRLVDVLEGTRPAFNNRDSKYLPELINV